MLISTWKTRKNNENGYLYNFPVGKYFLNETKKYREKIEFYYIE